MRSSTGAHFIALDHVRALAAFWVFAWHFTHGTRGYPVPFEFVPSIFPFSVLDEGHTGVALFMTLSAYLFAKLLDGKKIDFGAFLWNRSLRLFPLLLLVIAIVGIQQAIGRQDLLSYAKSVVQGAVLPTLPNGGWSITVEVHFYLLLPFLLWMLTKSKLLPLSIVLVALALRVVLFQMNGEVQSLAYWTIIGRIDQFVLGMLAYQFRAQLTHRHVVALLTMLAFTAFYWYFDLQGGYYKNPSYPSPSPMWIFMPTLEGLAYGVCIAWYDNSFSHSTGWFSRFIGRIGEYSYSIYLLHPFIVFRASKLVHERIMDISNFYVACIWAAGVFAAMVIPAAISYRFVEAPFLKLRRKYVISSRNSEATQEGPSVSVPEPVTS